MTPAARSPCCSSDEMPRRLRISLLCSPSIGARPGTGGVRRTGPKVNDKLAIHPGCDRCTDLVAQREVLLERLAYPLEARRA